MRETDLPSPGIGGKGHHLRRIAANAISQMAVAGPKYTTQQHPAAAALKAFFDACSAACALLDLITPVISFTPTSKAYSIASGATAGPTLAKGGSAGAAVYTSSDVTKATVNSSTGAVTGVAVGTCTITATVAANGAYRQGIGTYVATIGA